MGFVSPVKEGLLAELGVALDRRGNVAADTSGLCDLAAKGVRLRRNMRPYAVVLVCWAIREGRQCARRDRRDADGRDDAAAVVDERGSRIPSPLAGEGGAAADKGFPRKGRMRGRASR